MDGGSLRRPRGEFGCPLLILFSFGGLLSLLLTPPRRVVCCVSADVSLLVFCLNTSVRTLLPRENHAKFLPSFSDPNAVGGALPSRFQHDPRQVARMFNTVNGIEMGKASGFLRDAYAWAGMATFVHDDVFKKGIHPLGGITLVAKLPQDRK